MAKKVNQVSYKLSPCSEHLDDNSIKAILRGADELISAGGRGMLAKILKGSKDKKLLEHQFDQSPVYSYFKELSIEQITQHIDRAIIDGFLKIEYDFRLPVLVFTQKGWEIEMESYAHEVVGKLKQLESSDDYRFVDSLKDRHRGMIFRVLELIAESGDKGFIPVLEYWKGIDYKKFQQKISGEIMRLRGER